MKVSSGRGIQELRSSLESESDASLLAGVDSLGQGSLTPEAEGIARDILRMRGVAIPDYEACPRCGIAMTRGSVAITGSWKTFLLVGFSYMSLFFREAGSGRRIKILRPDKQRMALRCGDCGFLITTS